MSMKQFIAVTTARCKVKLGVLQMLHVLRWTSCYTLTVTTVLWASPGRSLGSMTWLRSEIRDFKTRRFQTHSHPDLVHDLSEPLLSPIPAVFTLRPSGIGVNGCIYMVMTPMSLAVQSAQTCVFVCSGTVCFEIRGSVYQRRLRNFRSRERRVQRKPMTELISRLTSKSAWAIQLHWLKPNIYPVVTYK